MKQNTRHFHWQACLVVVLFATFVAPSAWAWGCGHDTTGRCVLKKLPPEWQARFKPEWQRNFFMVTHMPDEDERGLMTPEETDWFRKNCGLVKTMTIVGHGLPYYGLFERLVYVLRKGDDYSTFIYLAAISHVIADGPACGHEPIGHLLNCHWFPKGTPPTRGLDVLPKTGREFPNDFIFAEHDDDTKAVLARRLDAMVVPEVPADITYERIFALFDRWWVTSEEVDNQNSKRLFDAGAKWYLTGDVAAKCEAADALCTLGLWAVERTLWVFKAAQIIAARPDYTPLSTDEKQRIHAQEGTNFVEFAKRPMSNDSFARPYFAEPGRPSRVRVMYSPIDQGPGSVFASYSRPFGCQVVGSLKRRRPGLNASLMDAREFARDGLDPKVTPVIVLFRCFGNYRGFDAKGFERRLRDYAQAGGKVIWISGKPPEYLIGKAALQALRDVDLRDFGWGKPRFPVPLDELKRSSVAWVGPGEKRAWKYVRTFYGAGWYCVGSPQWFDLSALPKDAVPLIELRTPGKTFLTGIACGSCAYLPLNAIFAYCLTDEGPQLDPFVLQLDSAGEAVIQATLDTVLKK